MQNCVLLMWNSKYAFLRSPEMQCWNPCSYDAWPSGLLPSWLLGAGEALRTSATGKQSQKGNKSTGNQDGQGNENCIHII